MQLVDKYNWETLRCNQSRFLKIRTKKYAFKISHVVYQTPLGHLKAGDTAPSLLFETLK